MAKPLGPGRAAFNGILSGTLASRNFTGPQTALECREGFFNAVTDTLSSKHLSGLGSHWAILEVGFKPHSACRYAHGPIDVAQHFYRAEGVRIADIEAVEVGMSKSEEHTSEIQSIKRQSYDDLLLTNTKKDT